jgi:cob(I)alamin adenosyltransferase
MKRVLVLTGDGKGKTTAGFGMLLRARGHGLSALVVQFIKAGASGELGLLERLGVPLVRGGLGFVPAADHPDFARHRDAAEKVLEQATQRVKESGTGFVLLDEACTACDRGLVGPPALLGLVEAAASDSILVFTGRGAPAALVERADTVTIMSAAKHALADGRPPQVGVEF